MSSVTDPCDSFETKLEPEVVVHLQNVYICLSASTMAAVVGAAINSYLPTIPYRFILELASLIILVYLLRTPDKSNKRWRERMGYFAGFCFLRGMEMAPLLEYVGWVDPSAVVTAILGTSLIFISLTICTLFSQRRYWLYLGGFIMNLLCILLLLTLLNIFLRSPQVFQFNLYVGLMVMCLLVLYDTELIIEKCRNGSNDFVTDSLSLFIDILGIFVRVLIMALEKGMPQNENSRDR